MDVESVARVGATSHLYKLPRAGELFGARKYTSIASNFQVVGTWGGGLGASPTPDETFRLGDRHGCIEEGAGARIRLSPMLLPTIVCATQPTPSGILCGL